MKLNSLIIDDEPVARKGMEEYVKEVEFLHLVAKCENSVKAAPYLEQGGVDLIFLDVHMPTISGIEFLKTLRNPPMVIFTTAYPEHALEGYSLNVMDYLVKPISFERFLKAANKALDFYRLQHQAESQKETLPDYFFVKCDGRYEKVHYEEVLYIEALQNYVIIRTGDRKLITYMTIRGLEAQLPKGKFIRVHKSYVVSLSKIKAIEGNEIVIGTAKIPISRNLKEEVMNRILGDNLLSR
jgi:DNA-binding LytR/AlgR family response regulator